MPKGDPAQKQRLLLHGWSNEEFSYHQHKRSLADNPAAIEAYHKKILAELGKNGMNKSMMARILGIDPKMLRYLEQKPAPVSFDSRICCYRQT